MRHCGQCGKPLDTNFHEDTFAKQDSGTRRILRSAGIRRWACRLRLVADRPSGGIMFVDIPQRLSSLNTRWVFEDRTKPGGDLHAA